VNTNLYEEIAENQDVITKQQEEIGEQQEVNTRLQEEISQQETVNAKQQEEITDEQELNSKQQEAITQQQTVNSHQQEKITEQETVNAKQQEDITKNTNEIVALKQNVDELDHVETGYVQFGNSDTWPVVGGNNHRQKDISVTFKTPYKQPPAVLISITGVDIEQKKGARHNCSVLWKSTHGCAIRCYTWYTSKYYQLNVKWWAVAGGSQ